jgi:uncharacterized RDD family membrane protein YckC
MPTEAAFCPRCGEQIRWAAASSTPPVTPPPVTPPKVAAPKVTGPVGDRWPTLHALERELGIAEVHPALHKETAAHRAEPAVTAARATRVATVGPLWRRLLAWTVDASLLGAILVGLLALAKSLVSHGPPSRLDGLDYLAETLWAYQRLWQPAALLCGVLCAGYLALFTALGGQTPGKRLLGLSVIDRRGEPPGLWRSGARALFALVSGVCMLMGFFLVLVDRRRQTLHDKLSGTFVVLSAGRG